MLARNANASTPCRLIVFAYLHVRSVPKLLRPFLNDCDHLRLRHMQSLGDHQAAMDQEQDDDGVELKCGALKPHAEWDLVQDPSLRDPVCHQCVRTQARGNGGSLEIAGLAGGIVGDVGGCHVESCQTGQAAQHKDGQEDVVESRAQTDRESHAGGCKTE